MSSQVDTNDPITGTVDKVGKSWLVLLAMGILTLAIGIRALNHPFDVYKTVALLFGIWLVVSGVVSIIRGLASDVDGGIRVLMVISGTISILLGSMFFNEDALGKIAFLSVYIGVVFLFRGMVDLVAGISGTSDSGRGWAIFMGIVGIIAGIYMINHPFAGAASVATVGAWFLMIFGVMEIFGAFKLRSASKS